MTPNSKPEAAPPANAATPEPKAKASRRRWLAAACVVYAALLVATYGAVWRAGFDTYVPFTFSTGPARSQTAAVKLAIIKSDAMYSVWVVGRNAWTLLHRPTRLFHGERCHPVPLSMALGESALSLAVLGLPAAALTGDPVATFNFAVAASQFAAALAMFLLIARWTGEPAAGLAAGMLYAFHTVKVGDALHPYQHDTAWVVFGLYFAREWFASGRWRHAIGLAVSCCMQLAASLYPIVASVALSLPVGVWLIAHHGVGRLRLPQIVFVAALIAGAAAAIFSPYLELRETTEISRLGVSPAFQFYAPWKSLAPGGPYFAGWLSFALLAAALTLRPSRTRAEPSGDPRIALLAGALLISLLATGGNAVAVRDGTAPFGLPNLYAGLASVLPGLDEVRIIGTLLAVVFVVWVVLAGLGAGALIRRVPQPRRRAAGFVLVAVATLYTLRPDLPLDRQVHYEAYRVRPDAAALAFFERLETLGDVGPLIEVPMTRRAVMREGEALLLSAFHHRDTSVCTSKSFAAARSAEIYALGTQLPSANAVQQLRELGFTTVIAHHPPNEKAGQKLEREIRDASDRPESALRHLTGSRDRTAYSISPPGSRADSPKKQRGR